MTTLVIIIVTVIISFLMPTSSWRNCHSRW